MSPTASIIICTLNRAEHLRQTLDALATIHVPEEMPTELIVVDNGSADSTPEAVQSFRPTNMEVRYVSEPRRGQCYARNAGLAAAQGQVILFTDDDIRPPMNWIPGMCGPILRGEADAVAGGIKIAPHLEREWMKKEHRGWLACTEGITGPFAEYMIGANMAFSKSVLAKVAGFDLELGPGALGFYDETLFSWQLIEAGFRIAAALDVAVEHHFEVDRLQRQSFLNTGRKYGRSLAYVYYHWHQTTPRLTLRHYIGPVLRLLLWHIRNAGRRKETEGVAPAEVLLLERYWFVRQYRQEQRRPRNYTKRGLVKLTPDSKKGTET